MAVADLVLAVGLEDTGARLLARTAVAAIRRKASSSRKLVCSTQLLSAVAALEAMLAPVVRHPLMVAQARLIRLALPAADEAHTTTMPLPQNLAGLVVAARHKAQAMLALPTKALPGVTEALGDGQEVAVAALAELAQMGRRAAGLVVMAAAEFRRQSRANRSAGLAAAAAVTSTTRAALLHPAAATGPQATTTLRPPR